MTAELLAVARHQFRSQADTENRPVLVDHQPPQHGHQSPFSQQPHAIAKGTHSRQNEFRGALELRRITGDARVAAKLGHRSGHRPEVAKAVVDNHDSGAHAAWSRNSRALMK